MQSKKYIVAFCAALLSVYSLSARVILFDIHGVLLEESIGCYVKTKVMQALAQAEQDKQAERGLRDHKLFKMLCQLMHKHKPLGEPSQEYLRYKAKCEALEAVLPDERKAGVVPYETYLLFRGDYSPEYIHSKLSKMVDDSGLDGTNLLLMKTLVDAIFNRRELVDATMAPLHQGLAILKVLARDPENKIYVCSNAPASWVTMYHEFFPEIFGDTARDITGLVPEGNTYSSGDLGVLKPCYESFAPVSADAECFDIFLIDDTYVNVAGALQKGIRGVVFDRDEVHETIAQMRAQNIINDDQVIEINMELAKEAHERSALFHSTEEKNLFFD